MKQKITKIKKIGHKKIWPTLNLCDYNAATTISVGAILRRTHKGKKELMLQLVFD